MVMTMLLNLAVEPARVVFEVLVMLGAGHLAQRRLRVLAATPAGATRIVRKRYPQARVAQVRACADAPPAVD
jgi:hypothetical protein